MVTKQHFIHRNMLIVPSAGLTAQTTLSIEAAYEDIGFDENREWDLEVYDPLQMVKEIKTKLKGNTYKINTSGWKEGIYLVRVRYKDEVLLGKLAVGR